VPQFVLSYEKYNDYCKIYIAKNDDACSICDGTPNPSTDDDGYICQMDTTTGCNMDYCCGTGTLTCPGGYALLLKLVLTGVSILSLVFALILYPYIIRRLKEKNGYWISLTLYCTYTVEKRTVDALQAELTREKAQQPGESPTPEVLDGSLSPSTKSHPKRVGPFCRQKRQLDVASHRRAVLSGRFSRVLQRSRRSVDTRRPWRRDYGGNVPVSVAEAARTVRVSRSLLRDSPRCGTSWRWTNRRASVSRNREHNATCTV